MRLMKKNFYLLTLIFCVFAISACREDLNGPRGRPPETVPTSPAHPVLTYYGLAKSGDSTYPAIWVMNSDGNYPYAIHIDSLVSTRLGFVPSWSPDGRAICITQTGSGLVPDTIKAIDLTLTQAGTPSRPHPRTIVGLADPNMKLSNPSWSSTSAAGKIAYTMLSNSAGGPTQSLCVVSQSGGAASIVYTTPGSLPFGYCTWNQDDSKLAVWRCEGTSFEGTIMIFNTSTWTCVDSIEVFGNLNGMEWSRNGLNKLAFSMSTNRSSPYYLYYCDPSSGATMVTNGVQGYFPTWSSDNSSLLCGSTDGLIAVTPFTRTTTVINPALATPVKWKR
jgi:hypothetical protein